MLVVKSWIHWFLILLILRLDMVWAELHSHMVLQQEPTFSIRLESIRCLFVTCYHEFRNRKLYDRIILPIQRDLKKSPISLTNHGRELSELILFSKLFVFTKIDVPKNTSKRVPRHWIRPCLHKRIGDVLPIHFTVWKLIAPTK